MLLVLLDCVSMCVHACVNNHIYSRTIQHKKENQIEEAKK